MALEPLTRKFSDDSTETGFQFTFYCDICGEKFYKNKFVEYQLGKKAGIARDAGRIAGIATKFVPSFGVPGLGAKGEKEVKDAGSAIEKGTDIFAERFGKMSPQWHREHEAAFELAKNEAKQYFHQCAVCKRWTCEFDWDEEKRVCVEDAKQTICLKCNRPAGTGKFCTHCGAPLSLKCSKCEKEFPAGTKFCGDCGAPLG